MKRVLLFLRSRSTTGMLRAASASTTWLPTKPLPPVTRTFMAKTCYPARQELGTEK